MEFKEFLKKDLDSTFFNTKEFSEICTIDNNEVNIIIDNDELEEMKLSNNIEGLTGCEFLFHVKEGDLVEEPFVGQDILFKDKLYYINNIKRGDGVYTISIGVPNHEI